MAYPNEDVRLARPAQSRTLWYGLCLSALTILGVVVRLVGIARYPGLIYDEYYYVPAADVLLRRRPPVLVKDMVPGIDPNLLSHPPLSKEMIAAAIYLFGQHPLAWRLPGLIAGAAVPLLVAGIAFELFGQDRVISLIAGLLAALDGLSIVLSRVALPDSPALALVLAGLYALVVITNRIHQGAPVTWGRWLGLGLLLGAALAAEWIGGQAILLAWLWLGLSSAGTRRRWKRWVPATTIVPFGLYYASYFYAWPSGYHQYWLPKNPFLAFFKLQWLMLRDMWTLRFYHPWTANAWTWLGIPRPTAMILSLTAHHSVRLMAFSDPLVVWVGLASLVAGLFWIRHHPATRGAWWFLLLWFLCFYATWLLTPRSKFLYYFATASIGLDIAAAAGLVLSYRAVRARPLWRALQSGLAGIVGLSILYLLPLWVGMALPRPFYHAVWWPSSFNPRPSNSVASTTPNFQLTLRPHRRTVPGWSGLAVPENVALLPGAWTVFRGSATHNSVYHVPWHAPAGYALTLSSAGMAEAPAVSGQTAYVGTLNNQLYAVNLPTGRVKWSVALPNAVWSTPLVDRGLIIVGIGDTVFSRYEKGHGWIRGTGASGIMAFSASTGSEVWFHATTGEAMPSPVALGSVVYEVTGSGRLVALALSSGRALWSERLAGFDSFSSPIIVGQDLYVATNAYFAAYPARRSTVWAINLHTRRVVFARNLPVKSGLADCTMASYDGRLFVAGVTSISRHGRGPGVRERLFALNQRTGAPLWSRPLGGGQLASLDQAQTAIPLAIGSTVYEGDPALDRLAAFNARTGRRLWRAHLPAPVVANPVLVGHILLVPARDGRIVALNAITGGRVARDPYPFGMLGAASPVVLGRDLLQTTMTGELVLQPVSAH